MTVRRPPALGLALVVAALAAATAGAEPAGAVTLREASAAPADLTAGAPSRFDVALAADAPLSSIALQLPAGLALDAAAAPRCPIAVFRASTCDPVTRTGAARAGGAAGPLALTSPFDAGGTVHRLETTGGPGELGRLGVAIAVGDAHLRLEAPVTARADGGLDATFAVPSADGLTSIAVDRLTLALDGVRVPATCAPATTTITVAAAAAAGGGSASAAPSFTPVGCVAGAALAPAATAVAALTARVARATARLRRVAGRRPALAVEVVPSAGSWAREVAVALPRGLSLDRSRARRGLRVLVGGVRVRPSVRIDRDGLVAGDLPARPDAAIEVRLPAGAVRVARAGRVVAPVVLGVALREADGARRVLRVLAR